MSDIKEVKEKEPYGSPKRKIPKSNNAVFQTNQMYTLDPTKLWKQNQFNALFNHHNYDKSSEGAGSSGNSDKKINKQYKISPIFLYEVNNHQ